MGITPACAGKRPARPGYAHNGRDHPRMCGEKIQHPKYTTSKGGSPPHMRGKGAWSMMTAKEYGITPAHAGKSYKLPVLRRPCRDHPRTCGEKCCAAHSFSPCPGSPPHMRGKDHENGRLLSGQGITPAHAGKSVTTVSGGCAFRDHPRTCGEKTKKIP